MNIQINIDEIAIRDQVAKQAKQLAEERARSIVNSFFFTPNAQWHQTGGDGYKIIDELVVDMLLGSDFKEKIQLMVTNKLDAAIDLAVSTALEHHVKKEAFQKIPKLIAEKHQQVLSSTAV